jgi:hypothetical protein
MRNGLELNFHICYIVKCACLVYLHVELQHVRVMKIEKTQTSETKVVLTLIFVLHYSAEEEFVN